MPSEKLETDGECVVPRRSASTAPPPPLTSDVYQSPCYDNDSAEGTAVELAIEFAWCAHSRLTLPAGRGTRASGGLVFSPTATTALSPRAALPALRAVPPPSRWQQNQILSQPPPSRIPSPTTRRPSSRRPHLLQPVAGDSATSLGSFFSGLALPAICVRVDLLGQAISNLQTPNDQSSYQCGRR